MKSMKKSLNVGKVIGSLKKKASGNHNSDGVGPSTSAATPSPNESPETIANRSVKAFCESGNNVKGDEVLYLPNIVDAAESSPSAAAEAARVIRRFLGKDYYVRPSWQYNALMLVRILTDNPGETFTRGLAEPEFVEATRKLLKHGRDHSVRQMLMETLNDFEHAKMYDENLRPLISMWKSSKDEAYRKFGHQASQPAQPRTLNAPPFNPHSQNYFSRSHQNKKLPDPVELTSRLEEARTSAKLLEQVVMNTPPHEMLSNDLIKEFADRCQSASRSIQGYMTAENPAPDNDTMESLIDTNEQLQTALNQHKRAVLNARKQMGLGERPQDEGMAAVDANGHSKVVEWQQRQAEFGSPDESLDLPSRYPGNGKGKETAIYNNAEASGSGSGHRGSPDEDDDPFRDPQPEQDTRHAYEPFHPGFNATHSYLDRQDSAAGKLQMHGAEPDGATPNPGPAPHPQRAGGVEDDDDIYDAAPTNGKEPLKRY
ncbi:hypothetical protein N3K66_000933 [Trichothecium roseum]|uniref:Uncharacterized protein n=1 Tax=Trichothecium roseum TaxID=47278 RepID=A0ACC0VDC4_9HYPO|nr:hypothetical protein N3K66_000933 [Trichothecium roseum]